MAAKPPRLPAGHDALIERLSPDLADVRWAARAPVVAEAVHSLRLWADGSAVVGLVARVVLKKAPKGDGSLTAAIKCWEKATPRQREQMTLLAWRAANPRWANNNDHDPFPGGPIPARWAATRS